MDKLIKDRLAAVIRDFHLPRYAELPDVGLYLEQTVKYINGVLSPLGILELTGSMVSNYVKKGYIDPPVKKLYHAEQIARLIFIVISKSVLSMEHIDQMNQLQRRSYTPQVAYDYMCCELENVLFYQFELKPTVEDIGVSSSLEKTMFRSVIIAVTQIIYLNCWLGALREISEETLGGTT